MNLSVTFKATGNWWDAPVTIYRRADGSQRITRDEDENITDWVSRIHYPHAVVLVGGYMSPFDVDRQPVGTTSLTF